jgi:hypothetical protein
VGSDGNEKSARNPELPVRRESAKDTGAFWRVLHLTFRFSQAALITLVIVSYILGAIHFVHASASWRWLS